MTTDEQWMALAIKQAEKAEALGEVPVGAVLVKDGIDESFGFTDEFLSGTDPEEYCSNDRTPDDLSPPE